MDISKNLYNEGHKSFCWNEGAVSSALCENIFVADLLESWNLLEILQTPLTVKNSEKVIKSRCL